MRFEESALEKLSRITGIARRRPGPMLVPVTRPARPQGQREAPAIACDVPNGFVLVPRAKRNWER